MVAPPPTEAPDPLSYSLEEALGSLPPHRAEVFAARVERWYPDLVAALELVHRDPLPVAHRLLAIAAHAYAERDDDLHALDLRRGLRPDWFQLPTTVGYAAYADRYAGTLQGVADHLDHLADLGVSYLHLLPLLDPRPEPNDGGYAVRDYRTVRADLGTTDDLRALTAALRERGMSLCLDLVLNHVAREHAWAEAARGGDARKRAYFHLFEDRARPDAYERTLPEVFPHAAPGNFTWDDDLEAWVWTTFHDYQWDLDWSNPDVLCEFAAIVLELANHGVEVLRLDAIAFLWKREGTDCQNQPEVHALTQALRCVARIAAPALVFKAEAIVAPQQLLGYLGTGRHHGKVSDLAYHNSLMVQLWSMLATREVALTTHALRALPPAPTSTAWITYARCHDDIGWAVDDADAAAAGYSGGPHRDFLSDYYSGAFPGSWARGLVFGANPATGDRRISGSLASLAGAEVGDPHARARVRLAHALVLGYGGVPVIWSGDEVGLLNDPDWAADPAHAGDNRWAHRPRLTWGADGRPEGDREVLADLRALVAARRTLPHLHASTPTHALDPRDPGVLLLLRRHPLGPLLGAYNVTPEHRPVPPDVLDEAGLVGDVVDHLTGDVLAPDDTLTLPPYGVVWLRAAD